MTVPHKEPAAFVAWSQNVGTGHVRGGLSLIDEDDAFRMKVELVVEEAPVSGGPHVLALLLRGVKSLFADDAVTTE